MKLIDSGGYYDYIGHLNQQSHDAELAAAASLTQSVIARLETKKATPQLDTLLKVAAALGYTIEFVPASRV